MLGVRVVLEDSEDVCDSVGVKDALLVCDWVLVRVIENVWLIDSVTVSEGV